MQKKLVVKKTINLDADVYRVWETLTKPELTRQYMLGIEVSSRWSVGSQVTWIGEFDGEEKIMYKGKVLQNEFAKYLKYSLYDTYSKLADDPTNHLIVTYELTSEKGFTRLMITQGDYSSTKDGEKKYRESDDRWDRILNGLIELLER